jgi:hypothetical protein
MLWAEAAVRFRVNGVEWEAAQRLSQAVHDEFAFQDEWGPKVTNWLQNPLFDGDRIGASLLTSEVLQGAIGMELKNIKRADEMRMGAVLRKLGYERKRFTIKNEQTWRFVPTSGPFALLSE